MLVVDVGGAVTAYGIGLGGNSGDVPVNAFRHDESGEKKG